MPRFVYRLDSAIALALAAEYRPGEWIYSLRARSEAVAVELDLTKAQTRQLASAAAEAAVSFCCGRFPLSKVRPPLPEDPVLRGPYDLEARVGGVKVAREPRRRRITLEARGESDGVPYVVTIGAIPEQIQALAEQIEATLRRTTAVCPVCGRPHSDREPACRHHQPAATD